MERQQKEMLQREAAALSPKHRLMLLVAAAECLEGPEWQ